MALICSRLSQQEASSSPEDVDLASGSRAAKYTRRREEKKFQHRSPAMLCCECLRCRLPSWGSPAPFASSTDAPCSPREWEGHMDLAVPRCGLFNIVYLKPFLKSPFKLQQSKGRIIKNKRKFSSVSS